MACLVAHADWSIAARKRWLAVATPAGSSWRVRVEPVGAVDTLLARLREEAGGGHVLFGVDAPIGLPIAYAEQLAAGHADFPGFLRSLTPESSFFTSCQTLEEVGGARPFFPNNALGAPRRAAHAARLGLAASELFRRCERSATRRTAACLFWTLGANQVGKAALALWRELLLPALAGAEPPGLWPFDGDLHALLRDRAVTIAETYPAEALSALRSPWAGSKRRQSDRQSLAPDLLDALQRLAATPTPDLRAAIESGFGSLPDGEDRFDSLLGLLALLGAADPAAAEYAPAGETIRKWEGWIAGQTPS